MIVKGMSHFGLVVLDMLFSYRYNVKRIMITKGFRFVYGQNTKLLKMAIERELGNDAEYFYDIHCPDPSDDDREFVFSLVAACPDGLHLALLCDSPEGFERPTAEELDYACRVFESYFHTSIPVRTVILSSTGKEAHKCQIIGAHDCSTGKYKGLLSSGFIFSGYKNKEGHFCLRQTPPQEITGAV